jgi:hypothetical protein
MIAEGFRVARPLDSNAIGAGKAMGPSQPAHHSKL